MVRSRPEGGHYYVSHEPLAAECTLSSLQRYPWPRASDPGYVHGLRAEALQGAATGYAVVLGLPVGCCIRPHSCAARPNLFMDMLADRRLAEALLESILGILLEITGRMLDEVGDLVDVVMFADDLGGNERPLVSPALYRSLVKPRQRRYLDHVHARTRAKVVYHTCGAVYPLIGDFIDIGVDALNPVQVSAAGMDPARLKREFGQDICFWGGLDVVQLLPVGLARGSARVGGAYDRDAGARGLRGKRHQQRAAGRQPGQHQRHAGSGSRSAA